MARQSDFDLSCLGIGLSSWGPISSTFKCAKGWSDDDLTKYNSIITGVQIAGAMVGAQGCEPFTKKLGKLRLMHVMNLLLLCSIAVCMIDNIPIICVGRFFWGITFGCFSVICAKYNNEICPVEYKGPFGAISQLLLTFGVCIPSTMALAIPLCTPENKDEFMNTQFWRIIWLVPAVVAVIHSIILQFFFNHETPVYLREKGDEAGLLLVMNKFYHDNEIKARLASLAATQNADNGTEVTYKDTFFDSSMNRAAWVGIGLASFQQLTGINAIIFFSGSLFDADFAVQGTAIINGANFISTIFGMMLLSVAGRKTLMVVLQVFVIGSMVGMWYFSTVEHSNDKLLLVLTVSFICAFEFGPGPIVWLYISEVCNDKATSVGTVMNWLWTLIVSLTAPFLLNNWLPDGKTWLLFGSTSVLVSILNSC